MKKIILFLVLFSNATIALANDNEIWRYVRGLTQQIILLQQQIATVQGRQGPQGEQGPRGEKGDSAYYEAGDGIVIEGAVISTTNKTHHLGESYQGGIIFWLDETKQHGLIASKFDLNDNRGIQWRNGDSGNKITNARSDGVGAGATNTRLIISQQTVDNQSGSFAALIAAQFNIQEEGELSCSTPAKPNTTCYGDWYLPSIYELTLLKASLQPRGVTSFAATFAPDFYWSSTEADVSNAWLQDFNTGEPLPSDKASTLGHVRAVRRF